MKVKKTNASSPPTAPPTTAPTGVVFEPDDCGGTCDDVGEPALELETEVEVEPEAKVEPEAEVVKTRLGMEARLANEGL